MGVQGRTWSEGSRRSGIHGDLDYAERKLFEYVELFYN